MEPRKFTVTDDVFLLLPSEVKFLLCSYLCTQDILNLILATSSFLPIYPSLAKQPDFPLRRLLSHAALGEWVAAEAIWSTKSPCLSSFLLTCCGTVFHPNRFYENDQVVAVIPATMHPEQHKYVKHTAWKIAVRNEEFKEAELIGAHMSEEEKYKQFMEIFPTGKMVKYYWDLAEAKRRLHAVFEAIINDETIDENNLDIMNDATRKALYALYDYVKSSPEHQTGLVFDVNIYVEALQYYEGKFKQFKNWKRRSFWCVRVEEHLASLLGTRYRRPHTQGIGNRLHRRGCILDDNTAVVPFRRTDHQMVAGFNFFVGYYGSEPGPPGGVRGEGHVEFFQSLCLATTKEGESLCSSILAQRHRHV